MLSLITQPPCHEEAKLAHVKKIYGEVICRWSGCSPAEVPAYTQPQLLAMYISRCPQSLAIKSASAIESSQLRS